MHAKTHATREQWLASRMYGVGASDTPVILGLSQWSSPFQVWARKRGLMPEIEETERMRIGLKAEPLIIELYTEATGRKVVATGHDQYVTYHSDEHDHIFATLDGITSSESHGDIPLEIKTCNAFKASDWSEGPPRAYWAQVQHQLYVTGAPIASMAVLIGGQSFSWCDVERDDSFIKEMVDRINSFWSHVISGEAPEVDGDSATTKAISFMHPSETDGESVSLPIDAVAWDVEIAQINAEIKALEEEKSELQNKLRLAIGDSERGVLPSGGVWSWKTQVTEERITPRRETRVLRRLKG